MAEFSLGGKAEKWAHSIQNPKGLLDKLGVKEGSAVAIVGGAPEFFLRDLESRRCAVRPDGSPRFLFAEGRTALRRIKGVAPLWIVYPKGRKDITQQDVLTAGRDAGLVDIKVASFSETHTALKFALPKSKKPLPLVAAL